MTTKIPHTKIKDLLRGKKILIGILVIGIILISAFWVYENQRISEGELYACDKSNDCIIVDGIGCCACPTSINKQYLEYWREKSRAKHDCSDIRCIGCLGPKEYFEAKCIDKRCKAVPKQFTEQVTITTDKTEYEQGETVKIMVRNNLEIPIWYAQSVRCGTSFWLLETCEGEEVSYYEICLWVAPDYRFTKLNLTEILEEEWDGKLWGSGLEEYKLPEPGCYRIVFPYSYSVNKKKLYEDWGEDKKTIFSNEFTIK